VGDGAVGKVFCFCAVFFSFMRCLTILAPAARTPTVLDVLTDFIYVELVSEGICTNRFVKPNTHPNEIRVVTTIFFFR
jgi:hypothetical protein